MIKKTKIMVFLSILLGAMSLVQKSEAQLNAAGITLQGTFTWRNLPVGNGTIRYGIIGPVSSQGTMSSLSTNATYQKEFTLAPGNYQVEISFDEFRFTTTFSLVAGDHKYINLDLKAK